MRGDAAITPMHNADDHRDKLLNFPIQRAGGQRSSAQLPKSAVDLWDPLPQGPALRIQVVEYGVVMVVLSHAYRLLRLWSAALEPFWTCLSRVIATSGSG